GNILGQHGVEDVQIAVCQYQVVEVDAAACVVTQRVQQVQQVLYVVLRERVDCLSHVVCSYRGGLPTAPLLCGSAQCQLEVAPNGGHAGERADEPPFVLQDVATRGERDDGVGLAVVLKRLLARLGWGKLGNVLRIGVVL